MKTIEICCASNGYILTIKHGELPKFGPARPDSDTTVHETLDSCLQKIISDVEGERTEILLKRPSTE